MIGYLVCVCLAIIAVVLIYQGDRFRGGLIALIALFVATVQFVIRNPKR